jgi:hypothetical protein
MVRRLAFVLLAIPTSLFAQAIPVYLETTTPKDLGSQLAFELKEAIHASHSFRLVERFALPYIKAIAVTLDNDNGSYVSASYSFVYDSVSMPGAGMFIHASVQNCGRLRLKDCARRFLVILDAAVERLREDHPSHYWELRAAAEGAPHAHPSTRQPEPQLLDLPPRLHRQ